MTKKSEEIVDSIFKKLKSYKTKEMFLERKILNEFIASLFKNN